MIMNEVNSTSLPIKENNVIKDAKYNISYSLEKKIIFPMKINELSQSIFDRSSFEKNTLLLNKPKMYIEPKRIFENIINSKEIIEELKPPTIRMRFIDSLKYHKPTDIERNEYNLTSSIERIDLHSLNDLLTLCGARIGTRFQGNHIKDLREATFFLDKKYYIVDKIFKKLPINVSQYRFPPDYILPMLNMLEIYEKKVNEKDENNINIQDYAIYFQLLAIDYINTFINLKQTIKMIQLENSFQEHLNIRKLKYVQDDSNSEIDHELIQDGLNQRIDIEFESKSQQPYPEFLLALIQKYRRLSSFYCSCCFYKNQNQIINNKSINNSDNTQEYSNLMHHEWTAKCLDPPLDSLSNFAIYVSACIFNKIPLSKEERIGIMIFLQVIKCNYKNGMDGHEIIILDIKSQIKIARSIWKFLKTVRELRSIPTQEKNLTKKNKYYRCIDVH